MPKSTYEWIADDVIDERFDSLKKSHIIVKPRKDIVNSTLTELEALRGENEFYVF